MYRLLKRRPVPAPVACIASSEACRKVADPAAQGRALFKGHSGLIQRKLQLLSRRSGLPSHEVKKFCSWAMSKLVEDNYRVLASWQDRSSFATYLSVVLVTLVRDYLSRIAIQGGPGVTVEEGKRSPAAAPLQTLLSPLLCNLTAEDRLLLKLHYREGFSIDAISRLVGTSVRELDLARGRCLKSLRHSLEEAGLGAQGIEELIGGALGELPAGQGEKLWT